MNGSEIRAMKDELDAAILNFRDVLGRQASKLLLHQENAAAGGLLVFERIVANHGGYAMQWYLARSGAMDAEQPEQQPVKRASSSNRAHKGAGEHRHKYNANGVCDLIVNGKMCYAERQRAAKGKSPAAAPTPVERTAPLNFTGYGKGTPPPPDGDDDPFAGGTMGSSSTTERGR